MQNANVAMFSFTEAQLDVSLFETTLAIKFPYYSLVREQMSPYNGSTQTKLPVSA